MYGFLKTNKLDSILINSGANHTTNNIKTLKNVKKIVREITDNDKYQIVSKKSLILQEDTILTLK